MFRRTVADIQLATSSGNVGKISLYLGFLVLGCGLGYFVGVDAIYGHRLEVDLLGPSPPLVNDMPQIGSAFGIAIFLGIAFFLGWCIQSGGMDRPLLGLVAFSLFSDVIPAIYQIAILFLGLLLLERYLRGVDFSVPLSPTLVPIGLALILYLTVFLRTDFPIVTLMDFVLRATVLIMVLLFPVLFSKHRHLELFFNFLLVGACISALVGLAQLLMSLATGTLITFAGSEMNRIEFPVPLMGSSGVPRCTGLMLHPNHQANALGTVALLTLWHGLKTGLSRKRRTVLLSTFFLLSLGVFITFSRSGWLALVAGTGLLPFFRWPKFRVLYLVSVFALFSIGLSTGVFQSLYEIIEGMNASSADFRWHIDALALEAFQKSPWFGIGVGEILNFFNPYHLEIHNTYLQILAEMGIFGVLVFGMLFFLIFSRFRLALRLAGEGPDGDERRDWLIGIGLASSVLLVQNFVVMFLWVKFFWAWIAFIEASIFVSLRQQHHTLGYQSAFLTDEY
ncbi:MAG: hypothetical protein CMJ96_00355 [Planctomycetes bacterium]|nr:hypothetical protein [Planctomycetota bacterium]